MRSTRGRRESGEQPEEQPNRLATVTWLKRPMSSRKGEMEKWERRQTDSALKAHCTATTTEGHLEQQQQQHENEEQDREGANLVQFGPQRDCAPSFVPWDWRSGAERVVVTSHG